MWYLLGAWKFKHHKTFPASHVTRAYQFPLQGRKEKASSNWHARSDPLGSCITVGEGRGRGWEWRTQQTHKLEGAEPCCFPKQESEVGVSPEISAEFSYQVMSMVLKPGWCPNVQRVLNNVDVNSIIEIGWTKEWLNECGIEYLLLRAEFISVIGSFCMLQKYENQNYSSSPVTTFFWGCHHATT